MPENTGHKGDGNTEIAGMITGKEQKKVLRGKFVLISSGKGVRKYFKISISYNF